MGSLVLTDIHAYLSRAHFSVSLTHRNPVWAWRLAGSDLSLAIHREVARAIG